MTHPGLQRAPPPLAARSGTARPPRAPAQAMALAVATLLPALAAAAADHQPPPFSVHVPLYDPHLSATSAEIPPLLWAAQRVPVSVAVCGSFDGCAAIGQCCDTEKNMEAFALLRAAGITVLHYVPTMQLPAAAAPVCCNSVENVTAMVQAALAGNASADGVYFDVVTGLDQPDNASFFLGLHALVQSHPPVPAAAPRPVMFNPSTPAFLEAYTKLDGVRVNAFESYWTGLTSSNASRLFDWSAYSRGRFAMVVEKAATIAEMESALSTAANLHYGVFFAEPDAQDYWGLPPLEYWQAMVLSTERMNLNNNASQGVADAMRHQDGR